MQADFSTAAAAHPVADICHVCPPSKGGVADYVGALIEESGSGRKFELSKQTAIPLEGDCLLHYSGYGFSRRGAPLWLLRKLREDRPKIRRLGVFFHELYAFGPPWSSAFWLSPAQRWVARSLVNLCDFWMTSREGSSRWIGAEGWPKPHAVLPVASNVGAASFYDRQRKAEVVVFGGSGLREATYQRGGAALVRWIRQQGLVLQDVGPPMRDAAARELARQAGAVHHGLLPVKEVGAVLANASFGVVTYPLPYIAKSGVFASFAAYGVAPVVLSDDFITTDGLLAGEHYLPGVPSNRVASSEAERIGRAALAWYQPHGISAHASTALHLFA
jgi:hypothetical protein